MLMLIFSLVTMTMTMTMTLSEVQPSVDRGLALQA